LDISNKLTIGRLEKNLQSKNKMKFLGAVVALLGAATRVSAQAKCAYGSFTGLVNTDTNVAFVQGYYGVTDPTMAVMGGIAGLPWAYPIGKCTTVLPSATKPNWKFTCMNNGEWVLAENYGTDTTCTGQVYANHTIDTNGTLAYYCGSQATDAYVMAQMFLGACMTADTTQYNTYTVVGESMCAQTALPDGNMGFANFYCDMEGAALTAYNESMAMCMGDVCAQSSLPYGECSYASSIVNGGVTYNVYARPLECQSAEMNLCRDGTTTSCVSKSSASSLVAFVAVMLSAVMAVFVQ
jgi:hypothetical protein